MNLTKLFVSTLVVLNLSAAEAQNIKRWSCYL